MLSSASAAKCPRLCTCGSWRWPHLTQNSPARGVAQLPQTSASGAATSGGLTTGTGVADIEASGDPPRGRLEAAAVVRRGLFAAGVRGHLVRVEVVYADELHDLAIVVTQ